MHLVIDLLSFAAELSFELLVHIVLFEDQDEIMIIHSNWSLFPASYSIPPNAGKFDSSKWQSAKWAVNKSHIIGSRYFTIYGHSYPTYILILLWGPILLHCGRKIGTYTAHLKILRWKILGCLPKTNCKREEVWWLVGLNQCSSIQNCMSWSRNWEFVSHNKWSCN